MYLGGRFTVRCFLSALTIVGASLLTGCRAAPAPDAGFLEQSDQLQKDKTLPFDAAWVKSGINLSDFKKIYVAPIDTTHLLKLDWWDKANIVPGDQGKWAQELADYFRKHTINQFKDGVGSTYQVVDTPDDDSLIVELAIVEVVPTKVWLNAIGYALVGPLDQGTTAFEGRLRDGRTKESIAEFKDREHGQLDAVSVADLQWSAHSRHTLRIWSEDIEKMCVRHPGEIIAPMSTVTLRPW